MKKVIKAKAPQIRLEYSEHFPVRLIQRVFDLSVLIPLYKELCNVAIGCEVEVSIGRSTVCAVRVDANTAKLVTGWKGQRQ